MFANPSDVQEQMFWTERCDEYLTLIIKGSLSVIEYIA